MAATVRITINEDLGRVLETLKGEYPTLDYTELFKLGLSELYHKRERLAREAWISGLPALELSQEKKDELKKTLEEANIYTRSGKAKIMTVEQIMAEALTD
jgi:hypothetical protein